MTQSHTILFCGGGSLGHVMPSLAVAEEMQRRMPSARPVFVTAPRNEEIDAVRARRFDVHTLAAPKFPRAVSFQALVFPLAFLAALVRAARILTVTHPDAIFSKGGFVSVPISIVAALRRIPIILHTSDSVPNLSDALVGRMARTIGTGFAIDALPPALRAKAVQTGNPVRRIFQSASRDAALRITGFSGKRPVVMIIGGSQGAQSINALVQRHFDQLLALADVIHITGAGKAIAKTHARYFSRPLVGDELPHLLLLADVVVSRAGASALAELAALKKATILLPLRGVAHDHQQRNAERMTAVGAAEILQNDAEFLSSIKELLAAPERRRTLGENLGCAFPPNAAARIAGMLVDDCRC